MTIRNCKISSKSSWGNCKTSKNKTWKTRCSNLALAIPDPLALLEELKGNSQIKWWCRWVTFSTTCWTCLDSKVVMKKLLVWPKRSEPCSRGRLLVHSQKETCLSLVWKRSIFWKLRTCPIKKGASLRRRDSRTCFIIQRVKQFHHIWDKSTLTQNWKCVAARLVNSSLRYSVTKHHTSASTTSPNDSNSDSDSSRAPNSDPATWALSMTESTIRNCRRMRHISCRRLSPACQTPKIRDQRASQRLSSSGIRI